jgi:D-tyrosyl-tRNA(Tyr) deacylase
MKKIAGLRVFEDEAGKMNLSVQDVGGEVLLVSQFTLYGDTSKGFRPSFTLAERPERAEFLYEYAVKTLESYGVTVKKGVFGADMKIEQFNDGPVTILLEKEA